MATNNYFGFTHSGTQYGYVYMYLYVEILSRA